MIEKENISSSNILCLLMNKYQNLTWTREMNFATVGEIKKSSYYGFIRKELTKYWPYVVENCKELKRDSLKPEFASFHGSNYAMKILVDHFRNSKGYFAEITSTSSRIASDLISNINRAALSLVPFEEIGTRLYNSLEVKDFHLKSTYDQIDKVIGYYISKLMNTGVVDYGLSFYLYNKYLLNDERYLHLTDIKYLIVDDMDQASPAEVELILKVIKNVERAYLFTNPQGGFCSYYGADTEYLKEKLDIPYDEVTLEQHFCSSSEFIDFSKAIHERANAQYSEEKINIDGSINIDMSSQLRSDMIEKISFKIEELIKKGIKPKDIAVICPTNDAIISYELQKKTGELGISVMETAKKHRFIDNQYIHALVVLAAVCNEYTKIKLSQEAYKNFFSLVLQLDAVRSSLLGKFVFSNGRLTELDLKIKERIGCDTVEKYNYIKNWIEKYKENYTEKKLPLDEFFRRAFLEVLIIIPEARDYVHHCKNLCECCEGFINTLNKLEIKGKSSEERFLDFVRSEAKGFYSLNELQGMLMDDNSLILTSPYTYLTSNLNSKVQIWADINSSNWCSRNITEMTNSYVLRSNWCKADIYTEEIENNNRYGTLLSVVNCLIRKCSDELYIYGSEYSLSGYVQESLFADILSEILSERGQQVNE